MWVLNGKAHLEPLAYFLAHGEQATMESTSVVIMVWALEPECLEVSFGSITYKLTASKGSFPNFSASVKWA